MKGIQAWSPNPCTNILLKFFGEFVYNKSQRLTLDVSSASGILLFRDASQILCSFGQQILNQHVTDETQKYPLKYKGMSACFNILARCLGGKYINFGVFWLYGDKAINEAFSMMFQLILDIPLEDMMVWVYCAWIRSLHNTNIFFTELSKINKILLYDVG